jgi:hypothetical protein
MTKNVTYDVLFALPVAGCWLLGHPAIFLYMTFNGRIKVKAIHQRMR